MPRRLILFVVHRVLCANGSVNGPDSTLVASGKYGSFASVGDFAGIVMELYTNMATTLHFFLPGVATAIPVGPHVLKPDGAGCLMYSPGKLLERRILQGSFEEVERRLNSTSSIRLYWRDVKVCPVSDSIVHLVLHGQPYELFKLDGVPLVGSPEDLQDTNREVHHDGAVSGGFRSPTGPQELDRVQNNGVRQPALEPPTDQQHHPLTVIVSEARGRISSLFAVFNNSDTIPGVARVTIVIASGLWCTFTFHIPGEMRPHVIGPYRMVLDPRTKCLTYDPSDPSAYCEAAWKFYVLSQSLSGQQLVRAADLSICFSSFRRPTLTIWRRKFEMALTNIPMEGESPLNPSLSETGSSGIVGGRESSRLLPSGRMPRERSKRKATEISTSSLPKQLRAQSALDNETTQESVKVPPTGVYISVGSVLSFTRVILRMREGLSCSLDFLAGGYREPVTIGPFKLIANIHSGCLEFDYNEVSQRSARIGAFRRLSKELARKGFNKVFSGDIEICYSTSEQGAPGSQASEVELLVKGTRYLMEPRVAVESQGASAKDALRKFLLNSDRRIAGESTSAAH
ncbi:hypothetical protein FOZ60_014531 [Perkinsus olseni]|uniref:Uncharacterized protein n=1 Tax=Perkinsus olseni TaxID=32597 RepID=A0A7J6P956_PEROL|nr:hypothetical protein FOZ60_014531 [Perkinsus olseni]